MTAGVVREALGAGPQQGVREPADAPALHCRVCELEVENARLRLLVGELLVANQRLRERVAA
jgi:hypothetical protein